MNDGPLLKRVAITGGAGYVGSALVPYLLDRGYEVTSVDLMMYGDDVFGDYSNHPGLRIVKADIRDEPKVTDVFADQDAVIHLACVSNDPSFELDPELGKSINYDAFAGLLRAVKSSDATRFIYASSSSVYGLRDEPDVTEDSPCTPLTDYSKYKLLCEEQLQKTDMGDVDWVVVRPATVCGYSRRLRLDVVVNILTISALARGQIRVFGGEQLRPNIHIDDMVDVYGLLLESPSDLIRGQVFNAGDENLKVNEIAELVSDVVNDPILEIVFEPTDDNRSYHINSDRIRDVLGFETSHTVADAVRGIVEAYRRGDIPNALDSSAYYNIRRMQEVKL